jgi:hypothetical protein
MVMWWLVLWWRLLSLTLRRWLVFWERLLFFVK